MINTTRFASVCALALAAVTPAVHAATATTYENLQVSGSYTLVDGQIHQLLNGSYRIYDLAGKDYVDGGGSAIPGFGGFDGFGAYDKATGTFYAANSPSTATSARLYTYNGSTWTTTTNVIQNGYAGSVSNGSLYFTGLKDPYDSSPGAPANPNYISRFDSATEQRHLLIETGGNSAPLATRNGDVFYATYGLDQNSFYHWSAAEIATVDNANDNDVLGLGEDNFLFDFDGDANGIAFDDAGNLLFATSNYIAVVDIYSSTGYHILLDASDFEALGIDVSLVGIGLLSAAGDILADGMLYFSAGWDANWNGIFVGVQVPEPATYALIAGFAALLVAARLRRSSR